MQVKWNERTNLEKVLFVIEIVLAVALVVMGVLDFGKIWAGANIGWMLVLGTMSFVEAGLDWNRNRKIAKLSIGVGVVMYILVILEMFI